MEAKEHLHKTESPSFRCVVVANVQWFCGQNRLAFP